jgi:hypothetical protein
VYIHPTRSSVASFEFKIEAVKLVTELVNS